MADIDPAIAQKVLDADIRNKVKKVGDGGTLSSTERQVFLQMSEGTATSEEIREARISALMRKWMDGGRLSLSERDEIAHLLPDAVAVNTEAVPLPQQPGALIEDDVLRIYGISRAKYFRWKQAGAAVPEGPDPPPFDDPKEMVQWYERMRERGIFKHKLPRLLKDLAAKGLPSKAATIIEQTTDRVEQSASSKTSTSSSSNAPRAAPAKRGFLVEFEQLEEHVAILREDYKLAYAEGREDDAARLKTRYFEALAILNKAAKEKPDICLAEKSMVKCEDVEDDLSSIIPNAVANLIARPYARGIYDELGLEALGMAFDVFFAVLKRCNIQCFNGLVKSKFAPPYDLEALAA